MRDADRARVSTFVAVEPSDAFEVFTEETDLWWKRGRRFRPSISATGVLRFEGGAGGRLVEHDDRGVVFEVGTILVWEPGTRLVFEWRSPDFAAGEKTEVEICFEPKNGGTEVTVIHRGWSALRKDHPGRRGLAGPAFTDMLGLWWAELATSYRAHAARVAARGDRA
jgi:uncharacterized protein YndB with AHSA1/START domain